MTLGPRRAFIAGSGALGAAALAPAAARAATAAPREVTLLSTYVAGAGYYDAPSAAARLRVGDPLLLRRRPESAYDPRAIEIQSVDGAKLGYVPRITIRLWPA
jgi:HIRAN domain